MNKKTMLQLQAIDAAKKQNWETALTFNTQILEISPEDIGAWNRLGLAYIQLGKRKDATKAFQSALNIDRSNPIAQKHLANLKNNINIQVPAFSSDQFIEEPGKTKTVELHRLASKDLLTQLNIGMECNLVPKNRYISVEYQEKYIGALPEDLSFRLTKLIKSGNKYSCRIRSVSACTCVVFLREIFRAKRNSDINSFPLVKSQITAINDIDDTFLKDDVPVQIVETDNDYQKNYESVKLNEIESNEE